MEVGRKAPHHFKDLRHDDERIIFLTVCTKNRQKVLCHSDSLHYMTQFWKESKGWVVGKFIILPDHVHFFAKPKGDGSIPLQGWMKWWKSQVARKLIPILGTELWQRDFWDTSINRTLYPSKWRYVEQNPVRHGYVSQASEWKLKGEINPL